jgi:hypothetical protein
VGASLVGLGGVHMDLEEYEEALPYFDDALIVFTEVILQTRKMSLIILEFSFFRPFSFVPLLQTCGAESLEIADCHNCLGSILQVTNNTAKFR